MLPSLSIGRNVWVGSGEEKALVYKFCQDMSLFNIPATKLAAREDESPDTAVEYSCSQEHVEPWMEQKGCMSHSNSSTLAHPVLSCRNFFFLSHDEEEGVGLHRETMLISTPSLAPTQPES